MSGHWAWDRVKKLGASAGIEGCRPHRLRHSFASQLYEDTDDIELVSRALGHVRLETTRIYAQARPARVRKAIDQLHFDL